MQDSMKIITHIFFSTRRLNNFLVISQNDPITYKIYYAYIVCCLPISTINDFFSRRVSILIIYFNNKFFFCIEPFSFYPFLMSFFHINKQKEFWLTRNFYSDRHYDTWAKVGNYPQKYILILSLNINENKGSFKYPELYCLWMSYCFSSFNIFGVF